MFDHRRAYWRANTTLIRNLLSVWALVSLGCSILLVQPLNALQIGSLQLGFWDSTARSNSDLCGVNFHLCDSHGQA